MFPYINIKSCFFLGFSLLIFRNDFIQVAQEVGVPTSEYSLQQIAYDAQALLYKFVWCQGWTDERWREVMQQVARRLKKAAQPGQKDKLDSNALFEMVFGLATRIRN